MLIKKLPHILVTLLVAVLIGCSSSNPLADEAQSNFENQNFEATLTAAEKSIEQHPGDARGYFYKAVALGGIAENTEEPAERTDLYKQMNENFQTAKNVADTSESTPDEITRIQGVKEAYWRSEFKRGYDLATNDSLKQTVDQPMVKSMQHLENATLIMPEMPDSWNVYAQVSARNNNYEQAATAKSKYISMIADTSLTVDDYLHLGFYYSNLEEPEKELETYQKGQEQFPDNQKIVSSLADAYLKAGDTEKAMSLLEQLVEQDPKNAHYRLVMGTKIYQQSMRMRDSVITNSNEARELQKQYKDASESERENIKKEITELSNQNEQLMSRISELTDRAEKQIKAALEIRPDDAGAYETLGIIYQNRAKAVFDERNRTDDNEKAAKLDKKGKDLIRQAMKYYEKAVEIDPDNKRYWRSLSQIYPYLGMDEKAQEAMKKAGLQ